MYTIKAGKTMNMFHNDLNSIILTGKNQPLDEKHYANEHYNNKIKEIKALRKFQELFQKQKVYKTRKDREAHGRESSPHQLSNRLKGMFFLKKKLELQEKYKQTNQDEFDDEKVIEAKRIPSSVHEKKKQKSKLNFVNTNKTTSGKTLQKPIPRRPQTRLESTICVYKNFNSQNVVDLTLIANKTKVIHHQSTSFFYFNVYVEDGNNSQLIKNIVRKRSGWRVVETLNVANMVWSQFFRLAIDCRQQRKVKEFEGMRQASFEKSNDLKKSQTLNRTETFRVDSRITGRNYSQKKNQPNSLKSQDYDKEVLKICPFYEHLHRKKYLQVHSSPSLHFYNHFPNHHCISDKKNLLLNLKNYYENRNENVFDVIPLSIEVRHRDLSLENLKKKIPQEDLWIVKPAENSNRGRGIVVCKDLNAVVEEIMSRFQTDPKQKKELSPEENAKEERVASSLDQNDTIKYQSKTARKARNQYFDQNFIVQKYIEPLLYNKRKFDIRMFLLVTGVKGKIRGYLYNEGYVRTCCKLFTFENFNKYIHLTNDAIQYRSADYGKYEEGNKLGWKKFQTWIEGQGYGSFWQVFEKTTKKISRDVLASVRNKILKKDKLSIIMSEKKEVKNDSLVNHPMTLSLMDVDKREDKIYYEIFGLDFLIGRNLKIWLIQVNTNPSLNTDCSRVVNNLIPKMLDNAFDIAVEPYTRNGKITDPLKYENKFEAVYDDEWDELYRLKTKGDYQ